MTSCFPGNDYLYDVDKVEHSFTTVTFRGLGLLPSKAAVGR